jgi:rRNA maturation RNase YbeY
MKHRIVVLDRTKRLRRTGFLKGPIEALLDAEDQPPSCVEILIADADEIRGLNLEFRGVDSATDVLSFPAGDGPESVRLLGEVAVCLPVAERQAAERGISIETELSCLAVHGTLHLLGFDDETDTGRAEMIEKMNAIVSACGMQTVSEWASIY